jgi:hypothetical protein
VAVVAAVPLAVGVSPFSPSSQATASKTAARQARETKATIKAFRGDQPARTLLMLVSPLRVRRDFLPASALSLAYR